MSHDTIRLRGVRVHNLQNVDVDIPRGKLIAVCGLSGSGKTSLAIDTLYAEGQRRYIESFSAYTRQFLERIDKPDYDSIEGLPPALAVRRGSTPRGNRSTVGTASETLDYLRLLFSKIAKLNCHQCGQPIVAHGPQSTALHLASLPKSAKVMLAFAAHWEDVAERADTLADLQASGFVRLLSGEQELLLGQTDREALAKTLPKSGTVWVVVDRLKGGDPPARTTESLETAYARGYGEIALFVSQAAVPPESISASTSELVLQKVNGANWLLERFSQRLTCTRCDLEYPAAEPRLFNFNSPLGACGACEGFGDTIDLDMNRIVPDPNKTLRDGAIAPWNTPAYSQCLDELLDIADDLHLPVDVPYHKLTKKQLRTLHHGAPAQGFEGLDGFFAWLERKKYKMHVRVFLSRWRSYNQCAACQGARLNPLALSYRVANHHFADLSSMEIQQVTELLRELDLPSREREIAIGPQEKLLDRLGYLQDVGLGYLTLDRTLRTLSGGEAQRTALTAALGSSLVNMLYVLDEPSVGLHPHDVERLSSAIGTLSGRGNTVVMIEHEELLLQQADWLIEVGPAAGAQGGRIVCSAPRKKIAKGVSLTVDYLNGVKSIAVPSTRRSTEQGWLELTGCTGHNLQHVDASFPLGTLCLVTGVSGSGKSSLVQDTLYPAIVNQLSGGRADCLPFEHLKGLHQIDECISVDQNPISRSPRSNPITYVKAFDEVRSVFAGTVDAKIQNYSPGHFSFNSDLGRCANCKGDGSLQIDMQFLADVVMTCPVCHGRRYRAEILQVKYRDQSIADVLDMTVREAIQFFRGQKKVQQKLQVLVDVGLGYVHLGQPATTLSAGEGQRLKLATHLASASRKRTLFILDEPTTGLHTHDLLQLLGCFNALLTAGHSLIVVEHNLHLMAAADYILDIGPGPAHLGGRLVAAGTPEQVSASQHSQTAPFLREHGVRPDPQQ
ncbi:excinuclease ABC subunit UvrA [Aureliella helgolandensis]|uniref:UvrABC system protein A n=1 Tax=Aureliella helgolandensis TaxID=2527968 RepID=A0A518GBW8_9BACT|nr:excinuclease ABC subunit UvrA [Aureliella helgolandensis]QDV26112.1 UvrABC system protein A [Aureliella helgolandensis]